MKSNIPKLYLSNFLTGFVLFYSIEKLFMRSIGISTVGIALNAIAYVLVSTILNVPVGILADKWNRKYTLMIGIFALALSSFVASRSHDLLVYMIASSIWGIYAVCTSGTYQAMTYDSLVELDREDEYVKQQGRSYGTFLVGIALSSVVGGYVANKLGYRATYLLTIIPCAINLLVLLSMREPDFHKETEDTRLWQHIKKTASVISVEQILFYLSMMFIAISLLNTTQNEYSGLYFIALGFGAVGNGWANAAKWLFSSFGQFLSNKMGRFTRYLTPFFFLAYLAFALCHSPFGLVFFFIATFTSSIVSTNIEGVLQHNTPSSVRATMLSLLGFITSLIEIPVFLVFGIVARHSVFNAYLVVAVIGLLFTVVWLLRPRSIKKQKLHVDLKVSHS